MSCFSTRTDSSHVVPGELQRIVHGASEPNGVDAKRKARPPRARPDDLECAPDGRNGWQPLLPFWTQEIRRHLPPR